MSIAGRARRYAFLSMAVLPISRITASSEGNAPLAGYAAEVFLEPFDPVCGVDHSMDAGVEIEIGEVVAVEQVAAHAFYGSVVFAPFIA